MTRSEAVEHLKNSTVKIENASCVGTGFFIADKLIATCYHNIKGHTKEEQSVYWQGEAYTVTSMEINQDDDLALLEIKIDKKHPILQIDEIVEVGDECQSFGYSTKNGDVITFEYEGKDGDGRLKFKDGLFQSGLSGGAILNFSTHKICGIVKSKRDNTESVALGGRGIAISNLRRFLKSNNYDIDDNGSIFSKEMFKNWVWTSSVKSADKLQFSILALVETFLAVGVSFFVWFYYGFYWHIVTGLLVAPLFFLRTKKSEIDSLRFLQIKFETIFYLITVLLLIINFIYMIYIDFTFVKIIIGIILSIIFITLFLQPLIGLFIIINIKIFFTFKNLSLSNIPKNWFKIIMSTDMFHPPEVIPGIEKTNSILKFKYFSLDKGMYEDLKDNPFYYLIKYMIFIPIIIFRYSLKSTAWIYLPLIWLVQPQDKQNLTTRLKMESKNFIAYLMFFYSLIVVFVFTFLPIFFSNFIEAYSHNLPQQLELIFFAYPSNFSHEYGIWYFTRLFSALITIVFMFSFTKILIKREIDPSYGDFWGAKLLSLRTVRSVLTLVTLGFTAYHIFGLLPDGFFSELWGKMKFLPIEVESK
ncbi:hypothetical protein MNB_SV-3-1625 [hydrothermal vent metagenome]|uniref:Serine protease n=1 Tax=hydrothermal vent metagenome TaxID=652676 RepID=A0A1W1CBL4_9ZZZZ